MSGLGEFSTHDRHGDYVTKRLTGRHPAGECFVTAVTRVGAAGMRSYLDQLRLVPVRLPDDLHVVAAEPLTVQHRWVAGPNLLDTATTNPTAFTQAVEDIVGWVENLDHTDARIDTNLANFCLTDDGPVLVDVLPPLLPSLRPEATTLFDELFQALCFDTTVILNALVGYALRALLRTANPSAAQRLLPIVDQLPDPASHEFPAMWYRGRRTLAVQAVHGQADPVLVHELFAMTSVLGFRQLDEPARQERIKHVAHDIKRWDL